MTLPDPTRPEPLPPGVTRRDVLNGLAVAGLGAGLSGAGQAAPGDLALRQGLQGQTDALRDAAHRLAADAASLRTAPAQADPDLEDLVVVGAGLSGLAGAHLFRAHAGRPVRILLLDALDDLGGHARRNEFVARSGQRLVGYGGSQSLDTPGLFSPAVHALLRQVGIELPRFQTEFFDQGWARRHGVAGSAWYFDRREWGRQALVRPRPGEPAAAWAARMPLSPRAQADLLRLRRQRRDVLPQARSPAERRDALAGISYQDFLLKAWRVDPAVVRLFQHDTQGYFGVGIDATTALDAWAAGLPGFQGLALGEGVDARQSPSGRQLMAGEDDYIYHFPDGNHGVARALLRELIPAALPGSGMARLADVRLEDDQLDRPQAPVRLRLGATVLGLRHLGEPARAEQVELRYRDASSQLRSVRARQVLLACWHRVIPQLTDELPAAQVAALNDQIKVPLIYANVLLSNWRAFRRLGAGGLNPVDGFWGQAELDFPVNMGEIRASASPDEPILLHLGKVVLPRDAASRGLPAREQAARGRALLMGWPFELLETEIRRLLQGALGRFGFQHQREIEAITINRWAHGYSYEYMRPWDAYWPAGPLPCETARQGWGRVAIANADAGAFAYAHGAIDQATRAVQELLPQAQLPAWHRLPGPDPARIGLSA